MSPTINDGDRMTVTTDISSGIEDDDVVVFKSGEKSYCKRVVAKPGDVIEIKAHEIYVNRKLKYKTEAINEAYSRTLEKDEFYVVGDNIDNSYDSRVFGPIKIGQIIGKVIKIEHKP